MRRVAGGSLRSHSIMPPCARLRQVADVARRLARQAQARHLVVAPEGAVDQHAIAARHGVEHLGRDRAQPRRVEDAAAARDVADQHADVVARHWVLAVRRVRRGLAASAAARAASGPARRESGTWRRPARCGGAARRSSGRARAAAASRCSGLRPPGRCTTAAAALPRSRSISNPVAWSTWPSISTTAAIAVSRTPRAGCSAGLARICSRMSGEALNRMPSAPSSGRTKIDDCVRGLARTPPERTPAQLRQLQFHCGKPPPAAVPSVVMRIIGPIETTPRRTRPAGRCIDTPRLQRAATYIVISKPRRISVATGVCHCMEVSFRVEVATAPAGTRGNHTIPRPHAGAAARAPHSAAVLIRAS